MQRAFTTILFSTLPLATLSCLIPLSTQAQVTPDGTTSTTVNQNGNNFTIEQGDRVGDNLFHSFNQFSVPTLGSAAFNNAGDIANIFSRVTGSSISSIDGLISSNGVANLFLINPNGIVFGENASLNLGGSFFASTADSLLFEGKTEFSASNPQAPPLLEVSIPIGLNFRNEPGDITNQGNLAIKQDFTLSGGNLDLQGQLQADGDLTLQATDTVKIRDSVNNPFIAVGNGQLLVQGNQNVNIFALNHPNSGLFSGGDLILRSANAVSGDAHYWSGGNFKIEQLNENLGNFVSIFDPIVFANGDISFDGYEGASLHILAGGSVNINSIVITGTGTADDSINPTNTSELANVTLSDDTQLTIDGSTQPTVDIRAGIDWIQLGGLPGNFGVGINVPPEFFGTNATNGDINIGIMAMTAPNSLVFLSNQYKPNLSLTDGSIQVGTIFTNDGFGRFTGNSGSVYVDSRNNFTAVTGINTSSGVANAGEVNLIAENEISFSNNSFVQSGTLGIGTGGNIDIKAKSFSLNSGAILSSGTQGQENAGNINIEATETVSFDGEGSKEQITSIDSTVGQNATGRGGNINIATKSLSATNGAILTSGTRGQGNAGDINITASETVSFDGESSQGTPTTPTGIGSPVLENASGKGGNVNITTGSLFVTNGALISSVSGGQGDAGSVNIIATDTVSFDGERISNQFPGGIFNQLGDTATGKAGNIDITTASLFVINGSVLSTSTRGSGDAGNITINASKQVFFDGFIDGGDIRSRVEENATGEGGSINISTPSLFLNNGAEITTNTFGQGNAGNITVNASEIISIQGLNDNRVLPSGIASRVESTAIGNGGTIDIITSQLSVNNNGQITTSTEGRGIGGEIKINSNSLFLENNAQITSSSFGQEQAGNIEIEANNIRLNAQSSVTVSSPQGLAGNLNIQADSLFQNQGQITAETGLSQGDIGANINLEISDLWRIENESLVSATAFEDADGGNININTDPNLSNTELVLLAFPSTETNGSDISANADKGNGGRIDITAAGVFGIDFRDISADEARSNSLNDFTVSSQFGTSGETIINRTVDDPTTGLINLPASVGDASDQISQNPCQRGVGSEFVVTGKGGLPPNVNESLNSESAQVGLIESVPSQPQTVGAKDIQPNPSTTSETVPAQGWVFNDQGEVTLTAYKTTNTERQNFPQTPINSCSAP